MKNSKDYDISDWFAVGFVAMIVLLFFTSILWIWVPEWWVTRSVITEVVAAGFFYFFANATERLRR